VFAAALVGGGGLGVSHEDFTPESLEDPTRGAIARRCSVVADAECDAVFPHHFPAIVEVLTLDGRLHTKRVMTNRGTLERPLSDDELAIKLESNIGAGAESLRRHLEHLADAPSVEELILAAAQTGPRCPV
jgi:2-methylcitrate dehydratase PrpD